MRRRLLRILIVIGLLLLLVLGVLHTPPVRSYARARAERFLRERVGMAARIGSLSYNLTQMTVEVRDISLAPDWRPDTPFFTAGRVAVSIGGAPFVEPWHLLSASVSDAHVTIVRNALG